LKTFPIDLIGIEPMKRVTKLLCCIFAMFVLTSFSVCHGQDVSGMTGVVTDSSGAALSGATVTLKNSSTGLQFTATTNSQGVYRFSEVPPGEGYTATFAASGFTAENVDNIFLTVSNIRTQNATLKVGSQGQVVEVTASGSEVTIDTTTATIGNTFNVQQLNNLPVQQRNDPIALFTLQPGVTDSGSVTGARVDQNNVTVDGLDVNDFATLAPASQPDLSLWATPRLIPSKSSRAPLADFNQTPAPPAVANFSLSPSPVPTSFTATSMSIIAIRPWWLTAGSVTMRPRSFRGIT
jgi:hypothetical protein